MTFVPFHKSDNLYQSTDVYTTNRYIYLGCRGHPVDPVSAATIHALTAAWLCIPPAIFPHVMTLIP